MPKQDILISFYGACFIAPNMTDDILSIKQKTLQKIGLNIDQMDITSDGLSLTDNAKINGYYQDKKLRLSISIKKNWKGVNINFNQSKRAMKIQSNENILGLKSKIQQTMGYDIGRQLLYYHGNSVTDNQRIDEIDIYEYSYFDLRLADQMQIFVKCDNDRLFPVDIHNHEMIRDVKLKIEEKENINFHDFSLIFDGKTLHDDRTVDEYGLVNMSEVNLVCKLKGVVQISIKTLKGETLPIEVDSSETVGNVKLIILDYYNLYPEQQKLLFLGSTLEDDKRIDEYRIKDGSVLNLVEILNSGMPILIERFDCESIPIRVYKKMTIAVVKEILELNIKINRNEQNLSFDNIILEDEQTFDQIPIKEDSVIELRLKDRILISARISSAETVTRYIRCEIWKHGAIKEMKKKICAKMEILESDYEFEFRGIFLANDKTIFENGIDEGSEINIVPRVMIEIFAMTFDGKSISLKLYQNDTIRMLKSKIQEKFGLSADEQRLVFQCDILDDDDKTIDECEIVERSVINVVVRLRGGIQIFVRTMDGQIIAFQALKTETITSVKRKIQEKTGLAPDEQKVIFQGITLDDDDKTVDECGIKEKSVITVDARLRGGMKIFAKITDGKLFSFEAMKTETIKCTKNKIQEKTGLATDQQIWVYEGHILDNDKTVDEYRIKAESVINVVACLRGGMRVFAKTMDERLFTFETTKIETIKEIKMKISEKLGLVPDEQKLVFEGEVLKDNDKTVDECGIVERSVINVIRIDKFDILLETFEGEFHSFSVFRNETIASIKNRIQRKFGMPIDLRKLAFQDSVLEDEKTIAECGISEGSSIRVGSINFPLAIASRDAILLSLATMAGTTISDIKRKIHDEHGIGYGLQTLMLDDTAVDDGMMIDICAKDSTIPQLKCIIRQPI